MADNDIFLGLADNGERQALHLPQANRHGLIAGATGTGKTVTLQLLAESFSARGVPVFMADVKGDLAGIAMPGSPTAPNADKLEGRARAIGLTDYAYADNPVVYWDLYGEQGHPIRTTVSEMGPQLLARLLGLNETQAGVLDIVFRLADDIRREWRVKVDRDRVREDTASIELDPEQVADLAVCAVSADEVLRNAQFALKRAKKIGETQIYEPTEAQAVRRRFSIETELRCAIEADQLTLAFQPLVHLGSGRIAGFEALARWNHEGQNVSPSEFIPVAEESGLIVQLGRWALDRAVHTLAEWDRQAGSPLPIGMSVNLSPIQISRDDVAGAVSSALASNGLAGSRLTLELTESAIIQDPDRAARALKALKNFNVRIAMDDFGTGFTSLSSLQKLPIDILKIDQSFVSQMLADADSTAIVRAVLSLARALGMETTAEGIDSEDLAEMVTESGCTYGQGYFYSEPLTSAEAIAYWLERSAAT